MIRVLFTANDTASAQMAAALLQHLGGERFDSRAAVPAQAAPDEFAHAVLAEIGIGPGKWHAEPSAKQTGLPWDYVITLDDGAPADTAAVGVGARWRRWKVPSIAVPDMWLRLLAARQLRDDCARSCARSAWKWTVSRTCLPRRAPTARTRSVSGRG